MMERSDMYSKRPLAFDPIRIKMEIQRGIFKCTERSLHASCKWLAELNHAIKQKVRVDNSPSQYLESGDEFELDDILMAQSYLAVGEYDRCSFFLVNAVSNLGRFLYFYSRFMACERRRTYDGDETNVSFDCPYLHNLRDLATDIKCDYDKVGLDGFMFYLYGVILKKLDVLKQAEAMFCEAVSAEPLHWGAWQELGLLIVSRKKLESLQLPNHWMKYFFLVAVYLNLQLYDEALGILWSLQELGFNSSSYILAQLAMIYYEQRDMDNALILFNQILSTDPFRLDNLDIFSNLLYVKEMRVELAYLAHRTMDIDRFRVETCCIVGNHYSLRGEHLKAVTYFQRAIKLNPQYLSAWTLMGHEFLEMKNTNAAIQCYRQAIEVNRRDYRAWYGLGQTYEILKMYFYCMHYYKQAQVLRPNDSRMLIALGEVFEKINRCHDALKCYYAARNVGDIESTALLNLAKLYEKQDELTRAAMAYQKYVSEVENMQTGNQSEHAIAYKYLAHFYLERDLELAHKYAQNCMNFDETKEEGKALMRTIAQKRS